MDSSSLLSASEETATILEETRVLFRGALDPALLKKQVRQMEELEEEMRQAEAIGAKALIKAAQTMPEPISDSELDAIRQAIAQLEKDIVVCKAKLEASKARRLAAGEETESLKQEEATLEQEWIRLGGEQEAKRREEAARVASAAPVLRKAISLNQHVTRIKWDYSAPDNELAGTVVDPNGGRAVNFRFTGGSEFELANRVWAVIG